MLICKLRNGEPSGIHETYDGIKEMILGYFISSRNVIIDYVGDCLVYMFLSLMLSCVGFWWYIFILCCTSEKLQGAAEIFRCYWWALFYLTFILLFIYFMYQNNATRVCVSVIAVHVPNWQGWKASWIDWFCIKWRSKGVFQICWVLWS